MTSTWHLVFGSVDTTWVVCVDVRCHGDGCDVRRLASLLNHLDVVARQRYITQELICTRKYTTQSHVSYQYKQDCTDVQKYVLLLLSASLYVSKRGAY